MVVSAGPLAPPADRLLAALSARGVRIGTDVAAVPADVSEVTLAVSDGPFVFDFAGCVRALGSRRFRVLVLSRLGAHPDARCPSLRRLWRLEEHARGGGAPTLTLRLAPLVGPDTPLIRQLRSRPRLPRGGRGVLNPVAESDAVTTVERALDGRGPWSDWFEVAGPETWSLAELRDAAVAAGGSSEAGAWEPALEEMAEHRIAEAEPWASAFGLRPLGVRSALVGAAA